MLFNSYEYLLLFLPATFFIYFFLLQKRFIAGAKGFLIFASLFFYAWWNIDYLPVILATILFNFVVGSQLSKRQQKSENRLAILWVGILANLGLLAYFKYANFVMENASRLVGQAYSPVDIVLPLAISFFTFQQIAYLIDSYRGETREYDFLNYTIFVTFFPQLIAGPIVHHREMMPQFFSRWNLVKNPRNIAAGLFLISIGLFKKVIIADFFSRWAGMGFDQAEKLYLLEAWATSLCYTFQLYFDFSGYTDMAVGAALLFNIRLPVNFNSPYKALNIQDFWRRWHITLSRFLRDYIYIPLGGNRRGEYRALSNILVTFIIGGIWHGAGWTFIFWGLLHGLALIVFRLWSKLGIVLPRLLAWFITFNFINIAWVFFRARSWDDAIKVLDGMFFGQLILPAKYHATLGFLQNYGVEFGQFIMHLGGHNKIFNGLIMAFILICLKNSNQLTAEFRPSLRAWLATFILTVSAILSMSGTSEFLYFNF